MENLEKNNVTLPKLIFQNTKDRNLRFLFCTDIFSQKIMCFSGKNYSQEAQALFRLTTFKVKSLGSLLISF